ncbi:MAG: ester cyclase [Pseudomonadota bacterium]
MKRFGIRSRLLAAAVVIMGVAVAAPANTMAQDSRAAEVVMDKQKETSRKSIEWWNSDFKVDPDALFAPEYVNHQEPIAASDGEKGVSLAELKDIVTSYHKAFPATKIEFQMQVVEGNRVATHWTFTGTQKGEYEGLAPTGKTVTWAGISIDEYAPSGKIQTTRVVWDKYSMFRELGLIK